VTNGVALAIALAVGAAIAADGILNDWTACLFLARKLAEFIEYLAFWR
jgi:hypothetical protein